MMNRNSPVPIKFSNTVIQWPFTTGFAVEKSETDCNVLEHSVNNIGTPISFNLKIFTEQTPSN